MSDISNLSPVWQEYLRTLRGQRRTTRIVEYVIHFRSGVSIDLTELKQDTTIDQTRRLIANAYQRRRYRINYAKNHVKKYKFPERERQIQVEEYTSHALQSLTGKRLMQAITRITTGQAVFAGVG